MYYNYEKKILLCQYLSGSAKKLAAILATFMLIIETCKETYTVVLAVANFIMCNDEII